MVKLNEQARLYMEKLHFQHIVLNIDKITS